ncbi:hypothetical protein L249_7795 [Ophiocordyceps polyrhachis-furcata BCC 54312]|uniref:Uncharacterized protein n=1 Tax=Ophiocordyceps polyrhachis-furcata BCC 54312 TaxID=1330021 RepID=A0A367L0Q5_9HYPO|nr:hypothetical protein L249_7795 [Ophiocordyceps polyrhachis-furcata BCC 54312]
MKGRPIEELVYECMFQRPKSTDPQNFNALLQRSLIPEVRQETHAFYGHLDTQEAKYPGLDYTHETHRIRLSRWPWHRRLFRAFNALVLTHAEIAALTKWEGTKWAKEKFEKEQGVVIRDTTADGFPTWNESVELRRHVPSLTADGPSPGHGDGNNNNDNGDEGEDSDDALESVGLELNQRLRAQAARREAGETTAVLDEEWEQWLKYAIETGELTMVTEQMTEQMFRRANSSSAVIPAALIPQNMLRAARAGQWSEIPEILQPVIRRTLDAEFAGRGQPPRPPAPSGSAYPRRQTIDDSMRMRAAWPRRTYSDLRLPVGEAASAAAAAAAAAATATPAAATVAVPRTAQARGT